MNIIYKKRVVIFDLLRIIAISMILISHLSGWSNFTYLFNQTWTTWVCNLFFWDLGSIGVVLFICISGAVLELNKKPIITITDYAKYMFRRCIRLYPAYWLSLLFAIAIFLFNNNRNFGNLFWQFSGFSAFAFQWGGVLNPGGWCIGLFVILYLLFPFISKLIEEKPGLVLVGLFVVSMLTTWWINTTLENNPSAVALSLARWFPLCSLFYFGLGIYIIRKGYYPAWDEKTGIISWFGQLSFYIFLFHSPIRNIFVHHGLLIYLAILGLVSVVAMVTDEKIQTRIRHLFENTLPVKLR